jgi:predicted glycosyltransferase
MLDRGHEVAVTARRKDVAAELLDRLAIPHTVLSNQATGSLGLAAELALRTKRLIGIARDFKPTVMTELAGPSIIPAARLLRIPAAVFYDTEFATRTNRWVYPLATTVCTPDCYYGAVRGTHITYPSYQELAYLHPERFTPDRGRLPAFGLDPAERFSVVRFVSWQASHDSREIALTTEQKREIVAMLEAHGRVLISSESHLPPELADHAVRGPVEDIHHLLAYATTVVGESATMASEAAVLGTPAVFIAKTGRGYTDDLEESYQLVANVSPLAFDAALTAIADSLTVPAEVRARRQSDLLRDKVDLTSWMVEFFEERYG